jgi:hypothetical protein
MVDSGWMEALRASKGGELRAIARGTLQMANSEWQIAHKQVGDLDGWDVATNGLRRLMGRRTWTKGPKDCKMEG